MKKTIIIFIFFYCFSVRSILAQNRVNSDEYFQKGTWLYMNQPFGFFHKIHLEGLYRPTLRHAFSIDFSKYYMTLNRHDDWNKKSYGTRLNVQYRLHLNIKPNDKFESYAYLNFGGGNADRISTESSIGVTSRIQAQYLNGSVGFGHIWYWSKKNRFSLQFSYGIPGYYFFNVRHYYNPEVITVFTNPESILLLTRPYLPLDFKLRLGVRLFK